MSIDDLLLAALFILKVSSNTQIKEEKRNIVKELSVLVYIRIKA
jgi:hypothetical protein